MKFFTLKIQVMMILLGLMGGAETSLASRPQNIPDCKTVPGCNPLDADVAFKTTMGAPPSAEVYCDDCLKSAYSKRISENSIPTERGSGVSRPETDQ